MLILVNFIRVIVNLNSSDDIWVRKSVKLLSGGGCFPVFVPWCSAWGWYNLVCSICSELLCHSLYGRCTQKEWVSTTTSHKTRSNFLTHPKDGSENRNDPTQLRPKIKTADNQRVVYIHGVGLRLRRQLAQLKQTPKIRINLPSLPPQRFVISACNSQKWLTSTSYRKPLHLFYGVLLLFSLQILFFNFFLSFFLFSFL